MSLLTKFLCFYALFGIFVIISSQEDDSVDAEKDGRHGSWGGGGGGHHGSWGGGGHGHGHGGGGWGGHGHGHGHGGGGWGGHGHYYQKCCYAAFKSCRMYCNGRSCEDTCRKRCGFTNFYCPKVPATCRRFNPQGCIPSNSTTTTTTTTTTAPSCPADYTTSGSKCFKAFTDVSDWLAAQTTCIGEGGNLAIIESADENAVVEGLLDPEVGWIGLQDFLNEGNFTWADGTDLGSYTNWGANQPDNNGIGQHCVAMRDDGTWNDVICGGERPFVCQLTI